MNTHGTQIKDVPDDLLIEILCRLPHCKYAFQCKCVSKHWLSLISNSYFVGRYLQLQLSRRKQPWAFMYVKLLDYSLRRDDVDIYAMPKFKLNPLSHSSQFNFSLKFLPCNQDQVTIVKASNGLILCCTDKFDKSECIYYICNPQTKQWMVLPPTPPIDARCSEVEFICEPYYHINQYKMFILNPQFKFKVFRFFDHLSSTNLNFQIFSSENGKWSLVELSLTPIPQFELSLPPIPHFPFPIFGIARALVFKEKIILMALNKLNEFFLTELSSTDYRIQRLMDFPGNRFCRNSFRSVMQLSSRQESLRVVQIYTNFAPGLNYGVPFLCIWELKDNLEWWYHQISFRDITSEDEWIQFRMPTILGFHPHNANLLYLNLNCHKRMALYNLKKKSLEIMWSRKFPYYYHRKVRMWCDVSHLELPLWPTPFPQISQHVHVDVAPEKDQRSKINHVHC